MGYDERILIHGFKYAVKSGNLKMFMIANRIISSIDGSIDGSIDDSINVIKGLLEGMAIPDNIKELIGLAPGGPGAKAAAKSFGSNAEAQEAESKDPTKLKKFGSEKRRSNRRKVQLAPTLKRVVKRRSLKKKCHA